MTFRKQLCPKCLEILRKYEKIKQKSYRLKIKEIQKQVSGKIKIKYETK